MNTVQTANKPSVCAECQQARRRKEGLSYYYKNHEREKALRRERWRRLYGKVK